MPATVGFVSSDALRHSLTMYHLYLLRDPDTNEVRYVGCCQNPTARLNAHRNARAYGAKYAMAWVARLARDGKQPVMEVIETRVGKVAAWRRERELIAHWFAIVGYSLLNAQQVHAFFDVRRLERKAAELAERERVSAAIQAKYAPMHERAREQYRRTYGVGLNGVWKMPREWAREIGISANSMYARLRKWSVEKALTTPKQT